MQQRFRIGITGGIGTGKSYVANLIHQSYGIPVYNTDVEAKRLMVESPVIREQLTALLGSEVYLPTGQLNRDWMRRFVFGSPEHVQAVNAIVHPAVRCDFFRWADAVTLTPAEAALQKRFFDRQVVAMESALLVEAQMTADVDCVLLVTASLQTRIRRTMQRDGLTEQAVLQRISHQLSDADRMSFAHHFITNDEDSTDLTAQLEHFINTFIH
jgi:dephospho-CoA kinase